MPTTALVHETRNGVHTHPSLHGCGGEEAATEALRGLRPARPEQVVQGEHYLNEIVFRTENGFNLTNREIPQGKSTDPSSTNKPAATKQGLLAIGKALPARGRGGVVEAVVPQPAAAAPQQNNRNGNAPPLQQQPGPPPIRMMPPPQPHFNQLPSSIPPRFMRDFPALNAEPVREQQQKEEGHGPGPVLRPTGESL